MATPRKNQSPPKTATGTAAPGVSALAAKPAKAPVAKAPHAPEPQHTMADPTIEPTEIIGSLAEQMDSVRELVRLSSDLGAEQARTSIDRVTQAAGEAASNLGAAVAAANAGAAELNLKAMDAAKANADAAFEFVRLLTSAKSLSEIVELQTEHARKQFEAMNEQARAYAELARKVSTDAFQPLSQTIEKTLGRAA